MKTLFLLSVAFTLNSTAFAAAETYRATVEDGTPKELKANTNIDSMGQTDQYLSEEVVQKRVYSPKKIIKKQELETVVESENYLVLSNEIADLKKKLEALEQSKTNEQVKTDAPAVVEKKVVLAPVSIQTATPQPAPAVAAPAAHSSSNEKIITFDTVGHDSIENISKRLKYTNDILKRYGRAYDYKTTTLSELKAILAYLEKKER